MKDRSNSLSGNRAAASIGRTELTRRAKIDTRSAWPVAISLHGMSYRLTGVPAPLQTPESGAMRPDFPAVKPGFFHQSGRKVLECGQIINQQLRLSIDVCLYQTIKLASELQSMTSYWKRDMQIGGIPSNGG